MLGAAWTRSVLVRDDACGLCRVIDANGPHSMAVPDFDNDLCLAETKIPPFRNSPLSRALKLSTDPFSYGYPSPHHFGHELGSVMGRM